MCGIAALVAPGLDAAARLQRIRGMGAALLHRGPDAGGEADVPEVSAALGHRRLAVLDLSPAGAQPMEDAGGRWLVAFNGEIYNHAELRARLARPAWRGRSDTETLVEAIAAWGFPAAVAAAHGMFAIAAIDRRDQRLWLARDRMGEKPLYYGSAGGVFAAASELPALRTVPELRSGPDRSAAIGFLRHGRFAGPQTPWTGLHRLPPGHLLCLPLTAMPAAPPEPLPWWSLASVAAAAERDQLPDDPAQVDELIEAELRRAIGAQMEADVPLGAFLSGGIDSSLVVALMQAQARRPVRTFTIGFPEAAYDESAAAAAVARHLGTEHTCAMVGAAAARDLVPRLPAIYGEPFADWSAIPTVLLCAETRRHVTVALSGDGADELFAGYDRYVRALPMFTRLRGLPRPLRRGLALGIAAMPRAGWGAMERMANLALPPERRLRLLHARAARLAEALPAADAAELHDRLTCHWRDDEVDGAVPAPRPGPSASGSDLRRMMAIDQGGWLADGILVKVDRAAMAASLETRAPFLDPGVVALSWRVPARMLAAGGRGKLPLRRILARHVPPSLTDRPKQGFDPPVALWLRGSLAAWAGDLLSPAMLARTGVPVLPQAVARRFDEHRRGRADHARALWTLLMLQSWWLHDRPAAAGH